MLLYQTPDTDAFVCKFNISHHYFTRCPIYSDPLSLYRAFLSLIYLIHYTGFDICCFHPFINHFANNYICNRITESTTLELVSYFYSNSLLFHFTSVNIGLNNGSAPNRQQASRLSIMTDISFASITFILYMGRSSPAIFFSHWFPHW